MFRDFIAEAGLSDNAILPIAELLAQILMNGGAAKIMEIHEVERRALLKKKYRMAVRFVSESNAVVASEELRKAA